MDRTAEQLTFPAQIGAAPIRLDQSDIDLTLAMEAALFASGEPIGVAEAAKTLGVSKSTLETSLRTLQKEYDENARGMRLLLYGDSAQFTTRETYAPVIRALLRPVQKQPLSQAVLETLSVVAYRQPVTRSEIDQVRGVKSDASVHTLINKGLIRELGRRDTLGHPMEFGTTDAFLRHFGLSAITELPMKDGSAPPSPSSDSVSEQIALFAPLESPSTHSPQ